MPQTKHSKIQLYDYDKLNTSSLLRRLITDIHGEQLYDAETEKTEPIEKWRWIQT